MNMRMSLWGGGVVMLMVGIVLWVYGYNVEPTAGQAIGNLFSGNFTDKRNAFMLAGMILAAVGGAGLVGGGLAGSKTVRV